MLILSVFIFIIYLVKLVKISLILFSLHLRFLAFSALTLMVGQQEGHPARKKTEWWGAGVVVCLE